MKLHIFNPEHDLALAANKSNYTAPHAGRQLHKDLAFIPALWADEGDLVLVDDIDDAYDKVRLFGNIYINKVEFITPQQLTEVFRKTMEVDSVHPWGWDKAIVSQLKHMGCPEIMLPTPENLELIRTLSGRRWAAEHLQQDVLYVDNVDDLRKAISDRGQAVVKAPWSSSGRGVRYVSALGNASVVGDAKASASCDDAFAFCDDASASCDDATLKWAANIIKQQGGVTVEPYYNKVKDFGMEFEMKDGKVAYRGLSLFQTVKGAYSGNILATEEEKEDMLAPFVSQVELTAIRQHVIDVMQPALRNSYHGPFGIDMMVCSDENQHTFVNPCIELNLRRTMGHVALAMGLSDKHSRHVMRIDFDGNRYRMNVLPGRPSEDAPFH